MCDPLRINVGGYYLMTQVGEPQGVATKTAGDIQDGTWDRKFEGKNGTCHEWAGAKLFDRAPRFRRIGPAMQRDREPA